MSCGIRTLYSKFWPQLPEVRLDPVELRPS
jgi:hypothetical protein